MKTKGENYLRT